MKGRSELHDRWCFAATHTFQAANKRIRLNPARRRSHEHDGELPARTRCLECLNGGVGIFAGLDANAPTRQQFDQGRAAGRVRVEHQDAQIAHAW